ncbi:BREX protein BrxB domain-containing protein [Fibrobacter sp. UWB7]|uniref:BREX protein BrxB domain-containing protein n=1 Tax=Fibrobacter sp. UWB7 TaxID=1896206 RepID=UPI00091D9719|nr:BREX protein BrxB domain-containing protein [Fibrobacter sp. UWB7]SHM74959.1 protein of unknown function [Fibrobacter sp. UWB7]
MSSMTLTNLYAKLKNKIFRNPANGDLFYNYYIFLYPAAEEYKWRRDILDIKEKLIRPADYIDTLVLNLFDEFCDYLDHISFGKSPSLLKYLLEKESQGGNAIEQVQKSLTLHANSKEFLQHIHNRITEHVSKQEDEFTRPYIFIHGVGQMYPYLRTSTFFAQYEPLNKPSKYKMILFYPGTACDDDTKFKLFGVLNDNHKYRSHLLINDEY